MNARAGSAMVRAEWFDGRQANAKAVHVYIEQSRFLVIASEGSDDVTRFELDQLRWPARDRHGSRTLTLPDGGNLHTHEAGAWHRLAREAGVRAGFFDTLRNHVGGAILAVVMLLLFGVFAYQFGVPILATGLLKITPQALDREVGDAALASVEGFIVKPSRLPQDQQQRIARAFEAMRAQTDATVRTPLTLHFRASEVGPNAFALPGGHIIMTDELVELARFDLDMILGVLAHEYGHVQGRHGMRLLTQSLIISAVLGLATGDVGGLIAGAPLLMSQLAYSRHHEIEADTVAIEMMLASGRSPQALAELFKRMSVFAEQSDDTGLGVLFSSHPPTGERIERFEAAAR